MIINGIQRKVSLTMAFKEILEERHEIARKLLLERDKIIQKYKDNFIEYYKYDELQNNYINVVQILNNKEKKESA